MTAATKTNLRFKKVLTMGDIAAVCQVAPRTVSKWFDAGRLKGYRIPMSNDRRVPREQVLKFLREHGMPTGDLEATDYRVLLVGTEWVGVAMPDHDFVVSGGQPLFAAGMLLARECFDCAVIDFVVGRTEAIEVARSVRATQPNMKLVGLAAEDEAGGAELTAAGFDCVVKRPFAWSEVAERIQTWAAERRGM